MYLRISFTSLQLDFGLHIDLWEPRVQRNAIQDLGIVGKKGKKEKGGKQLPHEAIYQRYNEAAAR